MDVGSSTTLADERTSVDEFRLQELIKLIESLIDTKITRKPLSYEKYQNGLRNIIEGREWNDNGE